MAAVASGSSKGYAPVSQAESADASSVYEGGDEVADVAWRGRPRRPLSAMVFGGDGFQPSMAECLFILNIAWPMALSALTEQVSRQATSMLVGHLSPLFLGAATMGMMFVNVTGFSLCFGGMSSMDTLCSQAFGAQNFHLVGTWAQRGALMLTFIMCPVIIALWIWASAPVFKLMGLDEKTADFAADYCQIYTLGLWPTLMTRAVAGFLRSQRIVRPVMYCTGLGSIVTTLFCFWAVSEYGFYGAPLGGVFGAWVNFGLVLLYCKYSGCHKKCWGGWSKESLEQWGLLAKLSTAGMMSTMGQWWSMEIAAGMAGILGTVSLAAHSCISNLLFFVFPFACGYSIVSSVALLVLPIESHVNDSISIATTIRIGNRLGEGHGMKGRQAGHCSMAMLGVFAMVYACITWALREQTPRLYTTDPEVLGLSASCIRIFSVYLVFSCGIWAVRASLNGTGKQPTSAKIALTSAYCVGIPSAALCCFVFGWGVHGLWVGLTLGNMTAVALLLYKVVAIDWAYETQVARDRALAKNQDGRPELGSTGDAKSADDRPIVADEEETAARRGLLDVCDEDSEAHSWDRAAVSDVDRLRKEYEEKLTEKDQLLEKLQRELEQAKSEVAGNSATS